MLTTIRVRQNLPFKYSVGRQCVLLCPANTNEFVRIDKISKIKVRIRWKQIIATDVRASSPTTPSATASSPLPENIAPGEGESPESIEWTPPEDSSVLGRLRALCGTWHPAKFIWRSFATLIIAGQVALRLFSGRINADQLKQQTARIGPATLGVAMLTASFVGMVFTIQFTREFSRLGLTRAVGGVLALAFSRELTPVITAIIMAGRVGSAIAAELGTMQVSEQTDSLRMLKTDPIDYLIAPRVVACMLSLPILTIISFTVGMASSVLLADMAYGIMPNIILESASKALVPWDLIGMTIKSVVFGGIVAIISCGWGSTTSGGAKGVGESTTAAVVISLVSIFVADFIMSLLMFQGTGDALTRL